MRKRRLLCLVLVLCAVLLTACQEKERFSTELPTATPAAQQQSGSAEQNVFSESTGSEIDFDDGSYDPASEEDPDGEPVDEPIEDAEPIETPAPTFQSEYAGATPVLIDPIDKPTPTPLPQLPKGTFATYEASALHLTFDAPANWSTNDMETDTYVLTNPDASVDYKANLVLRAVPVTKNFTKSELKKEINGQLNTMESESYTKLSASKTANRTFLGGDGLYVTFTGTTKEEGAQVAGRIMVVCLNKTLYIMVTTYPYGYREYYKENLYDKVRHTIKLN